jgi:hypothetical protein
VRRQPHTEIEISRLGAADSLLAFATDAYARAVGHARRNPDVDVFHVAVMAQHQPARRALKGIFQGQFDLVLDVASCTPTSA